jgi:hypothetical protein
VFATPETALPTWIGVSYYGGVGTEREEGGVTVPVTVVTAPVIPVLFSGMVVGPMLDLDLVLC